MGKRFLIVDDHPIIQRAMGEVLEELAPDTEVRYASRLSDAMRILRSGERFDLILLDLRLPDAAGVESLVSLRELDPECTVVVMSADVDAPMIMRCLDLGARLAEPGEFTRRAYLNGKLDLAQAEAVIDLIDAATTAAARSAVRSLQGEFSGEVRVLLEQLIELRALVEATLDFPDEEVDFLEAADAFGRLDRSEQRLTRVFERARQGRLLQGGLHVVLVGKPNVGKSSLLNRLAGDEVAIVTPLPGTTRDLVRSTLQVEGIPLHVIDTAGLRDTEDQIEKLGIERTWREIERADVVVLLLDARTGIGDTERVILAKFPAKLARVFVYNKIDLTSRAAERREEADGVAITLSARSGEGIELLRQELLRIAGWHPAEDVFIARERHLRALAETRQNIDAARRQLPSLDLFAEELRLAQLALSRITGEYSADDLLGEIFGRFCIGK